MRSYWIWLAQCSGVTPRQKKQLLSHFGDIQALYRCEKRQLEAFGFQGTGLASLLHKDLSAVQAIEADCMKQNVRILTYDEPAYPQRLREIPDPPMVLYCMGNLPDLNDLAAIGVVGTRKASAYGLTAARQITGELCRCGAAIVSGMAYGIDSAATVQSLDQGSITLGILGCGIDRIYPAANRALYYRMRESGCLICEYPPGVQPQKRYFPERNRIISGLSIATLVVEAPQGSGALITARTALEQNREVFAVPGSSDNALCAGSNALLHQGATPASTGWDILKGFCLRYPGRFREAPVQPPHKWDILASPSAQAAKAPEAFDKKSIDKAAPPPYHGVGNRPALSPQAQAVLDALKQGEDETDNVIAKAGLDPSASLAVLTMLEMRGLICRTAPQRIALKK